MVKIYLKVEKHLILVEIEAEKIECTGKVVFSLIMGVICLASCKR